MEGRLRSPRSEIVAVVALLVGVAVAVQAQVQGGPLPGPPATAQHLVNLEPREPYHHFVSGLLVRTRYVAKRSGLHTVEIWDLLVGPGKTTEHARLPGASVIEVRSGTGVLTSKGGSRELRIGSTFALDDNVQFTIANREKDVPLIMRLTLIRNGRR